LKRYEITVDGKTFTVALDTPFDKRSKIQARINEKDVVVSFSQASRTEPSAVVRVNKRNFRVNFSAMGDMIPRTLRVDGRPFIITLRELRIQPTDHEPPLSPTASVPTSPGVIVAPMPGKVMSIHVRQGDSVSAGQSLLMLEAMKMENELVAPSAGVVKEVWAREGASVKRGQALLEVSHCH